MFKSFLLYGHGMNGLPNITNDEISPNLKWSPPSDGVPDVQKQFSNNELDEIMTLSNGLE